MEKYYTIFDIISGLRPEYITTKEQLKSLKNYIKVLKKNTDINFYINTSEGKYPVALYDLQLSSNLHLVLEKSKIASKFIPYQIPRTLKRKGMLYYIPEKEILINDHEAFSDEVDKILNSSFSKNIKFEKTIGKSTINITSNYIAFNDGKNYLNYWFNEDNYYSASNIPTIDLLSCEIPRIELPEYHVELIEKNKKLKKIKNI